MTAEQLSELAESLSILSAKSSVLKERDELRALMEENLQAEEVPFILWVSCFTHYASRIPNHLLELLPNVSVRCSRK